MEQVGDKLKISITTGSIVRFFAVAVSILVIYYLRDIALVVLAAVVIASAIEPIVRRLKHYLKLHRTVAVVIVYIIIVAIIAAVLVLFVPAVINETVRFLDSVPGVVSLSDLWSPLDNVNLDGNLADKAISLKDFVLGFRDAVFGAGQSVFETASALFGGAFSLILIFVLSFYLAIREDGVDDFLRIVTPVKKHEYIINLWKRSRQKIGLWLQGQIILGLIVGLLVYISLIAVGIPYALALAVSAALLEIVPVFGPILASIPALLIAFTDKGVGTGLLVAGLYLVIHQLENHVFYPLVTKKIVGVNPIVVILALLIGAKLAGILGALVAVPLSAALMEYISDVEKRKSPEIIS